MASAKRVAQELGCHVGEEVGYHVRFDNSSRYLRANVNIASEKLPFSERTRILFMTDGILVQELLSDPLLKKYRCIILHEAHVRSANLDFLIPMLRRTLETRGSLKLIISR